MKRPTDAELILLLEKAANFFLHIGNKQVFRPGSAAAAQVLLDAVELQEAAIALRAANTVHQRDRRAD